MRTFFFLLLFLVPFAAVSQSYSVQIDSLTREHTARFARGQQFWVDSILAERRSSEWLKRIDSLTFDYAFIEETYNRYGFVEEHYFLNGDSIPYLTFSNGEMTESSLYIRNGEMTEVAQRYLFAPMLERYSKMQPNQELDYARTQYWFTGGCVRYANTEEEFRSRRKEKLKNTYAICTMIDKANRKVIVSVQHAPRHPEFEVVNSHSSMSF